MFALEIILGGANHKKVEHLGLANARPLPTAVSSSGTLMTAVPYERNLHITALASYSADCFRMLCMCTCTQKYKWRKTTASNDVGQRQKPNARVENHGSIWAPSGIS